MIAYLAERWHCEYEGLTVSEVYTNSSILSDTAMRHASRRAARDWPHCDARSSRARRFILAAAYHPTRRIVTDGITGTNPSPSKRGLHCLSVSLTDRMDAAQNATTPSDRTH
jgi:hypothetical protein